MRIRKGCAEYIAEIPTVYQTWPQLTQGGTLVKNTGRVHVDTAENNGDGEEINFVFWSRIVLHLKNTCSINVDTIFIIVRGRSSSSKHFLHRTVALQTQLGTFHTAFSMEHIMLNSCEAQVHLFSELLLCRLNWAAPLPQAGSMPSSSGDSGAPTQDALCRLPPMD